MRAARNESTGTSGESEVLAEFERLGWAGVIDSRHDTGTDLYLRPRDARRYELGAVMGAQVKTGRSYFSSPQKNSKSETTGWWFAEVDRVHFDYWLSHALPHTLILRDQAENRSYWVHVTPESVISTGKGAKILVPADQTVDLAHNESLSDVALSQRPAASWVGSAWTGLVHLSPSAETRHALITPRLIAPHPNLTPETITATEALAMQVLFRSEIGRCLTADPARGLPAEADRWTGLTLKSAQNSDDWAWRATAAIHLRHYQGEPEHILTLGEKVSSPAERAASVVLACTYHFDSNDPDAALTALAAALEHDDYSAEDHAWLQTQRARALLEVGSHQDAFDIAIKTQRIGREVPSDVTALAIAGACALISFRATGWMQGDLAGLIQGSDNPASWWRTQMISSGLSQHLEQDFRRWAQTSEFRMGGSGTAHRRLLSAALLASCTGDHDAWRSASSSLAEHLLLTDDPTSDPERIASYLTLLRHSGDGKSVGQATRRVVDSGPIVAARLAASEVDPARSTRTTAAADLEMLTAAGDVLDPAQADEICNWSLNTLRDPKPYLLRVRPTILLNYKIFDLLRAIAPTLFQSALHAVIDYFLTLDPVTDDGFAQKLARLIHAIPDTAWSDDDRHRAADRAAGDATYLREAFLAVAAPAVPTSQQEIFRRARAGELSIFDAIGDLRDLPGDAVDALASRLIDVIDNTIQMAATGAYPGGGIDAGRALALLSTWHPDHARWDSVARLLSDPNLASHELAGALRILASKGSSLPATTRTELAIHANNLRIRQPRNLPLDNDDIPALAAEAEASLSDEATRRAIVRQLLGQQASHRAACARIIERFGDDAGSELLLALSGDESEIVRDAALGGLTHLFLNGQADKGTSALLEKTLLSSGRRSAEAVAVRLVRNHEASAGSSLLALAASHPSTRIRNAIAHVGT